MEVNRVDSSAAAAATSTGSKPPGSSALARAASAVNSAGLFGNHELTLAVDRNTHSIVVRLVDRQTGQVIRQIPPQYLLDLAHSLQQASHPSSGPVR